MGDHLVQSCTSVRQHHLRYHASDAVGQSQVPGADANAPQRLADGAIVHGKEREERGGRMSRVVFWSWKLGKFADLLGKLYDSVAPKCSTLTPH